MFEGEGLGSLALMVDNPLGQQLWDVLPGSSELADGIRRSLGGEQDVSRTFSLDDALFHLRCTPSEADDGVVIGTIGVVTDVTGEVLARERQLQAVVTGAPVAAFTTDQRGMITSTTSQVYPGSAVPALAVGDSVIDAFVEIEDFTEKFGRSLTGESVTTESAVANHALGIQLSPILANDGAVTGVTGVTTDLTKQKRTGRFLNTLDQAARFMDQASTSSEVHEAAARALNRIGLTCWVLLTDKTQENLYLKHLGCSHAAAKAIEKLTGRALDEATISVQSCQACSRAVWQKQTSYVSDAARLLNQLLPNEFESRADVIAHYLEINQAILAPLVVDGAVVGIIAVASQNLIPEDIPAVTAFANQMSGAWYRTVLMQDLEIKISELQAAEGSLEHNRLYYQTLIENTSDILIVFQGDGSIRYGNPVAEQLLGDETGWTAGQNLMESIHPDDLDGFASEVARMDPSHADSINTRFRLQNSDGDYRTVEGTARNMQDDPAVRGIVISGRDITDQLDSVRQSAEEARLRDMLSESTHGLVQLSTKDSVYQFIGERMSKTLAECAVLVNSYDVSSSVLRVESIVVPGEDTADIWPELRSMRFTVPLSTIARMGLMNGALVHVAGGPRSIYGTEFPVALHDRIKEQLHNSETYLIGLASENLLL
ncbi:MAG: PAS domain S-box protein, partial [Anaerolineae bacterium]|nr:PAS domain S-box protein [Anaerolineae bacterium]